MDGDDGSRLVRLTLRSLLYGTSAKGIEPCLGRLLPLHFRRFQLPTVIIIFGYVRFSTLHNQQIYGFIGQIE